MGEVLRLFVLLGYCSLPTGECGVILVEPADEPYRSMEDCVLHSKNIDEHPINYVAQLRRTGTEPPWIVRAKCGTKEEGDEIIETLKEEKR